MVVLSDREYNELIAVATMDGYNKGYEHGRTDAIDEMWDSIHRSEKDYTSLDDITGFVLLREKKRHEWNNI